MNFFYKESKSIKRRKGLFLFFLCVCGGGGDGGGSGWGVDGWTEEQAQTNLPL